MSPSSEGGPESPEAHLRKGYSHMNYGNPPPYSDVGPSAPNPSYPYQPGNPQAYPPYAGQPYQGYPQYGYPAGPPPTIHRTVYVVEDHKDSSQNACFALLAGCWAALCCCCLLDPLIE